MNEPNLETKPKRILLASHMFGRFGGLEIYNLTVSHVLQKHGAIVQAISCFTSGNNVFEQVNVKGLMPNNFLLKRVYGRTWPYWLKRSLNSLESNYDLAIAGHVMVLPQVVDYAFQQNIPCWLIVFGIDIWGDWSREVEEAIEKCEQIIAISEYTADSVRRRLAGRKERVVVIHNSVDVNKFFPMNKKHTADDPLIILTVGRLAASERYKGHDLVISALPTVQKNIRQKVEYWIIGDGDDRSRLEQLAYSQGVSDIVRFLGRIEENQLIESYRKCDVFAMPSYVEQRSDGSWAGEGFGFVYIEAAACGKPVIACDVGGQTDAVLDGITGLLVKPTVDSVADALIELLTDREKAAQMGEAGRRFVVENFSSETFDQKWANLFNKLASR